MLFMFLTGCRALSAACGVAVSGGARSNCYKFVGWVTGCSAGTIGKVADQMRRTGGDREPPEHGLRHYRRRLAAGGGTAATTAAAAVAENRKESGVETSAIEEQGEASAPFSVRYHFLGIAKKSPHKFAVIETS